MGLWQCVSGDGCGVVSEEGGGREGEEEGEEVERLKDTSGALQDDPLTIRLSHRYQMAQLLEDWKHSQTRDPTSPWYLWTNDMRKVSSVPKNQTLFIGTAFPTELCYYTP